MWDSEADRFWVRNNVFLIVNSALLIVVTSFSNENIIGLFIAFFGFIFSRFWYRINIMGKYYLNRWKPILIKLESKDKIKIFEKELPQVANSFNEPKKYQSSSTYMTYVTWLISLIWLLLIIYYYLSLLKIFN